MHVRPYIRRAYAVDRLYSVRLCNVPVVNRSLNPLLKVIGCVNRHAIAHLTEDMQLRLLPRTQASQYDAGRGCEGTGLFNQYIPVGVTMALYS